MNPKRSPRTVWREDQGLVLLFQFETGLAKRLNETGTLIWRLCDCQHTLKQIVEQVITRYPNVTKKQIEKDITTFLEGLKRERLVEF